MNSHFTFPRCSMYGIFKDICPKNHPNVSKYSRHGASGIGYTLKNKKTHCNPKHWPTKSHDSQHPTHHFKAALKWRPSLGLSTERDSSCDQNGINIGPKNPKCQESNHLTYSEIIWKRAKPNTTNSTRIEPHGHMLLWSHDLMPETQSSTSMFRGFHPFHPQKS
jgi:hypothetical protein